MMSAGDVKFRTAIDDSTATSLQVSAKVILNVHMRHAYISVIKVRPWENPK